MAPVYGVAAEAGDGGGDSKAVAGDAGLAFAQLRPVAKGIAGHGYFCGLLPAGGTIEGRQKIEVDPFDGAGVAQLMYPELRDSGIMVTNPSEYFRCHGEHTMGLLLALARNFPDSVRHQDHAHWSQQELWDKPQHLTEINGKVLLIVGYGSIGREVAKRARAFEMRVWGVTRSGQGDRTHAEKIFAAAKLREALPEADYVLIAAPETAETRHLMGATEIAKMKRGARLINVGRGSLLDEAALLRALESGALGGAATDVAKLEPLPARTRCGRRRIC